MPKLIFPDTAKAGETITVELEADGDISFTSSLAVQAPVLTIDELRSILDWAEGALSDG